MIEKVDFADCEKDFELLHAQILNFFFFAMIAWSKWTISLASQVELN